VTRATLEAALAARNTPIDRSVIARPPAVLAVAVSALEPEDGPVAGMPRVVQVGDPSIRRNGRGATSPPQQRVLPDVSGMPMRDGVRRLHTAGFQVRIEGSGRVLRTVPEAGESVGTDVVIRVVGEVTA
jgi:hypothetical protein